MSYRNELKWANVQLPGTAKNFAGWSLSGVAVEIPPASSSDILAGTDDTKPITPASFSAVRTLARQPAAVSAGVMNLDLVSRRECRFENVTAIVANCAITFSNDSNAEIFNLIIFVTGTIAFTMPSSVIAETTSGRFNNGTKVLTLTGATASPFELSFLRITGNKYMLRASYANYTA